MARRKLPPRLSENRHFIASLLTEPSHETIARASTKEIRALQELLQNVKRGHFGSRPVTALKQAKRQAVGACLDAICQAKVPPAKVKSILLNGQKGSGAGGKILTDVLNSLLQLAPVILALIL